MKSMGDRIRHLRLKKEMTQEELGKIIGVQRSAIRKYESGQVENIKRSSIELMAKSLDVSPAYLMGWDDGTYASQNIISYNKNDMTKVPIYNTISSNTTSLALENIEGYDFALNEDIDSAFEDYFYIRIKDNAMSNSRIFKDDLALIKKENEINNRDIVLSIIDNEMTLRRAIKTNGIIVLQPESSSSNYETIVLNSGTHVNILGKVISVKFKVE